MSPEYDLEEFKRRFPNLYNEIFGGRTKKLSLRVIIDPWRGYIPTAVDYIRRCRTVEEAFEVINYLVKHGELPPGEAEKLRHKLMEGGLEAFGNRKEDNYYYKQAMRYRSVVKATKINSNQEDRDTDEYIDKPE